MSGLAYSIADEDGVPLVADYSLLVNVTSFIPGQVRDAGNSFAIGEMSAGAVTEIEVGYKANASAGTQYHLVADEDGIPLGYAYRLQATTSVPADVTAPTYSGNVTSSNITFSGATFTATVTDAGGGIVRYGVAVPHGDTAPSAAMIIAGKRYDGSPSLSAPVSKAVTSGVSTEIDLAGVLYDGGGVRYTAFDYYEVAVDAAPNISVVKSVTNVVIDSAATFAGITSLDVDLAGHTLTPHWSAATDPFDDQSTLTYLIDIVTDGGATRTTFAQTVPGATSYQFDPLLNGDIVVGVRVINSRGLIDSNTATLTGTLSTGTTGTTGAGSGSSGGFMGCGGHNMYQEEISGGLLQGGNNYTLDLPSRLIGSVSMLSDGTNVCTLTIRQNDASGKILFKQSTLSQLMPGLMLNAQCDTIYVSVEGTNATAQVYMAKFGIV